MPIILWLMGVPIVVVVLLMLTHVIWFVEALGRARPS